VESMVVESHFPWLLINEKRKQLARRLKIGRPIMQVSKAQSSRYSSVTAPPKRAAYASH
jgi:hypothetical protein